MLFTCNTTFSLAVEVNQKRIFLQEQHTNVIFILNHQVKQDGGGRAFSIDYLGPPTSKSCFVYQLTAKRMKTSLSMQSEPGIYTEWSSTDTHKRHYLTIPSDFEGYSGLLSLSVCIRKCISLQFEVETEEETKEVCGNEDNGNANGALQVVLADPGVLDCSICHESLCTPVFQCQNGHLACCLCCSKVETICPICYPLGYKFTRCRGLEVAIESIGRILCINETLAAAYSNKKSEHEQMLPPHSFQEDDDELIPIQDVEPDLLMSEEEEDEDKLELMGKNQQQHTTNNENEALQVVLDDPNILDCMICSNWDGPSSVLPVLLRVERSCFKSGFVYQLTAKSMETCLSLRSVPEIYTEWSKDTPRKCNLTVPSGFADYDGILSLSVCIKKKVISSEFEEEMENVRIDEYISNLDGSLKVEPPNEGQPSNAQAVQAVEPWKHSDFLCHNYVLNGLVDSLYNVYCKTTTAKELWESLERKYKIEDAGTKFYRNLVEFL
ncbi:aminotransferase-like mobile domain-containing protein [Tanacetum coccineum]